MPRPLDLAEMENRMLTEFSQGYAPTSYINRLVLPPIPVTRDKGSYFVDENGLLIYDTELAPRADAKTIDFATGSEKWEVFDHALAGLLSKKEIQAARETGVEQLSDLKETLIAKLITLLEAKREKNCADRVFGAAYYDSEYQTDNVAWNDEDSDPIGDIMTGMEAVRDMGAIPNSLVLGRKAYNALRVHPKLIAFFKNQMGMLSDEQIKNVLGVTNIIVGDNVYNSGSPKNPILTPFWGDHCAIYPIHSAQEMKMGARVHTVLFDKLTDYHSYEEDKSLNVLYTQTTCYGLKTINTKQGYLIKNVIASS